MSANKETPSDSKDPRRFLDGGTWTQEMINRYEVLTGPGGVPEDEARSIILREAGVMVFPSRSVPPLRTDGIRDEDIVDATQRVEGEEADVPPPAPPQPGESDDDTRNRIRKTLQAETEGPEPMPGGKALPSDIEAYRNELRSRSPEPPVV